MIPIIIFVTKLFAFCFVQLLFYRCTYFIGFAVPVLIKLLFVSKLPVLIAAVSFELGAPDNHRSKVDFI